MLSKLRGKIKSRRGCDKYPQGVNGFLSLHPLPLVILLLLAIGAYAPRIAAQELDPAALSKPATDTWPTYNGAYSGKRFSSLDQNSATNVNSLTLAWVFHPRASTIKATPLEVNGVLYFPVPDTVWAV